MPEKKSPPAGPANLNQGGGSGCFAAVSLLSRARVDPAGGGHGYGVNPPFGGDRENPKKISVAADVKARLYLAPAHISWGMC